MIFLMVVESCEIIIIKKSFPEKDNLGIGETSISGMCFFHMLPFHL
jgi:hypothetical protein